MSWSGSGLQHPEDLLPSLWSSPVGEVTKTMVRSLTPQTSFTPEQAATRDAIGARLQNGFETPMAIQLLLANFLYSPPGLLTIANAETQLPQWLVSDYNDLYSLAVTYNTPTPSLPPKQPEATASPATTCSSTARFRPRFPATLQELVEIGFS